MLYCFPHSTKNVICPSTSALWLHPRFKKYIFRPDFLTKNLVWPFGTELEYSLSVKISMVSVFSLEPEYEPLFRQQQIRSSLMETSSYKCFLSFEFLPPFIPQKRAEKVADNAVLYGIRLFCFLVSLTKC